MTMDLIEAREVLGLTDGVTLDDERAAYRRLLRVHHPDVAPAADAQVRTTVLIQAYEVVVAWAAEHGTSGEVLRWPAPATPPSGTTPPPSAPDPPGSTPPDRPDEPFDIVDAQALDEDTIAVDAPPPEAYAALFEAASRVGNIAYVDRQLGIIETMVRFEGGPTCSVVMTLQGRATFTEVFCTMESIEAAPAPPIAPVIDALVEALRAPT
jgi:hypothetical protein